MGKKKDKETSLETVEPTPDTVEPTSMSPYEAALAEYSPEELADLQSTTGLEDIPEEERRHPLYAFNLDMRDERGNDVRPNLFYNCQTGEMQEQVNCALIFLKKTREYSDYDETTKTKKLYCRSWNMKVGMPVDDENAQCADCENCRHKEGKQGERKNCTIVLRFLGYDLDKGNYFVLFAQRTSFIPIMRHLEGNFFGQHKIGNKRYDVPLYFLHTRLGLEEKEGHGKRYYRLNAKVATDAFENGVLPKEMVMSFREDAKKAKQMKLKDMEAEEPQDLKYADQKVDEATQGGESPPVDDDGVPF